MPQRVYFTSKVSHGHGLDNEMSRHAVTAK